MSCGRRSRVAIVEVVDRDVAIVKEVMVNVELVIAGVAAIAGDAKNFVMCTTELQSMG